MDGMFPVVRPATRTNVRSSVIPAIGDCERRAFATGFREEVERAGFQLRRTVPSAGAIVGTGAHNGIALINVEKANTGSLGSLSAAIDCADETYREEVRVGALWDETTPKPEAGRTQVRQIVAAYHANIAPRSDVPVLVEAPLNAEFGHSLRLTGHPDFVSGTQVRDHKTGRNRATCGSQLGAYSLLARSHGYNIIELWEDWLPRTPIGQPQKRPASYRHDLATCERATIGNLRRAERDLEIFRNGAPGVMPGDPWAFNANPDSRLCSAKWCPAHGTQFCSEWKKQ